MHCVDNAAPAGFDPQAFDYGDVSQLPEEVRSDRIKCGLESHRPYQTMGV